MTATVDPKLYEISDYCTSLNLKRASRAVSHIVDSYLRPHGLRSAQFGLLLGIMRKGPITATDLADSLVMDITTISRNIRLLERDGLVKIAPGKDRRFREIELTQSGYDKLCEVRPIWQQAHEQIKESLGESNWEALIEQLKKVADLSGGP